MRAILFVIILEVSEILRLHWGVKDLDEAKEIAWLFFIFLVMDIFELFK